MSFAISEVLSPTSITTAALIPQFSPNGDVLAAARGNRLYLYPIENDLLGTPQIVKLYGTIHKIIPLSSSMVSNILVILTDLRSCILNCDDDGNIHTVSAGNLTPSPPCLPLDEIKYAVIPSALVIKFHSNDLTVYPITSECEIGAPFPITISCKSIVDFVFIGPISRVTRLAVLTEEYHDNPKLHLFEIDLTNNLGTEDINQTISLPEDTYMIFPYLPETHSVVMSFSSLKAISVTYASGLPPKPQSYTIFTPNKLAWFAQMKENFYAFIDDKGTIRVSEISEDNMLRFTDLGKAPIPSSVVAVTGSLLFVAAKAGPAHLFEVQHTKLEKKMIIDNSDSVREFTGETILFQSAIAKAERQIKLKPSFILQMKGITNIWSKQNDESDSIVLSSPSQSYFLEGSDGVYEEKEEEKFTKDETTIYFSFEPVMIQVTPSKAIFGNTKIEGDFIGANSDNQRLILIQSDSASVYDLNDDKELHKFDGIFTAAAFGDDGCLLLANLDRVTVFDRKFNEINSFSLISPVVSLFMKHKTVYAAHAQKGVTLFANNRCHFFNVDGFHSVIKEINGKVVVFGENPVCFDGGKLKHYGSPRTIDGTFLGDQIIVLSRDGLTFCQEQRESFQVTTFSDEKMPMMFRQINGGYVYAISDMIYASKDFISARKTFLNPDNGKIFKLESDVVFMEFVEGVLVVLTKRNIHLFIADSPSSIYECNVHKNHQDGISLGVYKNQLYVIYLHSVKFYHVERTINGVEFADSGTPRLDNHQAIVCGNCGSNLFVFGDEDGRIRIFAGNEMKEIANGTISHKISKISVLGDSVLVGTSYGEIIAVSPMNDSAKQVKIESASSLSAGFPITAISKEYDGYLLVGNQLGQVFKVTKRSHPRGFSDVYQVIEQKVFSEGHLNKMLERSVMFKRYILRSERFVDMDLINDFLEMSPEQQQSILESQINRDDALATLLLY
ncbi:hypothetical protein TVAG_176040 [Trichomonas vaginalis G3]|uniref:RSE1/DDB1/CPSF1 first beta-propeller domain-containing protein n=1 Tax=Trichomonas vaginalis (strain ATCC PRA-98 / G3) TaxID=412133 RepID=A2G3J7_TRIV3|nr:DNA repair/RNA processing CPSF family [Trichomonas vaginalis G3]EAX88269.1 hypothetical protein TVAG_176040 [Trichomonas vaginalis G3]KAI5533063.1 DNA repair/RNA processing CPSF family [Trichomonas vaginalis G3]|eukprot:XP_001301199.1 hypothetical protein [Trichomonas vaginalis G3]